MPFSIDDWKEVAKALRELANEIEGSEESLVNAATYNHVEIEHGMGRERPPM
jgi:hypothetical protein